MKKERRKFKAEEKVKILKRHLVGKEEVSDICEELCIHVNQFYRWQAEFFENGANAFENKNKGNTQIRNLKQKIEKLEQKISHKESVIAEITEDYVKLKKNLGEL